MPKNSNPNKKAPSLELILISDVNTIAKIQKHIQNHMQNSQKNSKTLMIKTI